MLSSAKRRMKDIHPVTHTRLAANVRGHLGTIALTTAVTYSRHQHRSAKAKTAMITPCQLDGPALWGTTRPTRQRAVDAWESSLERVDESDPQQRCGRAVAVPAYARDEDGPVFREPGKREPFEAAGLTMKAGVFTWKEWAGTLGAQIKRALAEGDPIPERPIPALAGHAGNTVSSQGRHDLGCLHRDRDAWEPRRRPHDATAPPIELLGRFGKS